MRGGEDLRDGNNQGRRRGRKKWVGGCIEVLKEGA